MGKNIYAKAQKLFYKDMEICMENKPEEWAKHCLRVFRRRKEHLNKIAAWLENEKADIWRLRFQNGDSDGYVNEFCGPVFVTKGVEIVYALPEGRDVPAGAGMTKNKPADYTDLRLGISK